MKTLTAAATALSMVAAPATAATANPAASLSVAKSARAGTVTKNRSELAGGGLIAALVAAGIVAIGVVAIVNDSDDSDSN